MPVIDHHDDLCESFLTSVDIQEASEIMKVSSWKESSDLLDRDFALILVDDLGKEHRKFACFDAGNAVMSEWYLLNADHGLPEEASKVAAANIANALESFGLSPAEATVYWADPSAGSDSRRVKVANTTPASYTANVGAPSRMSMPAAKMPAAGMPAAGMAAKGPSMGVKMASAFDYVADAQRRWDDLDPYDRHEVAVNLVKVASDAGASIPNHIFQYSGTTLNPMFSKIAESRRSFSSNTEIQDGYRRLSKMAAAMDPEDVVEAMYLLDEQAQLNHRYGNRLPDPVLSVYGTTKEAEYSWILGSDYVTASMLKRFSGSDAVQKLDDVFSEDFTDIFKKDPLGTFKRLPEEQQILISRMASQSRDTNNGGY